MTTIEALTKVLNENYTPANGAEVPQGIIKSWAEKISKDGSIPADTLNGIIQNIGEWLVKINDGYFLNCIISLNETILKEEGEDLFNLYLHTCTYCAGDCTREESIKLIVDVIILQDDYNNCSWCEPSSFPGDELHFWTGKLNDEQRARVEPLLAKVQTREEYHRGQG